jgi:hypothetical protein
MGIVEDLLVAGRDANGDPEISRFDATTGNYLGAFVTAADMLANGGHAIGMTWGTGGHLYVAQYASHTIQRYDGTTGAPMGTFADASDGFGGPGLMKQTRNLIFGPNGDLYVCGAPDEEAEAWSKVCRFSGASGVYIDTYIDTDEWENLDAPEDLLFNVDGDLLVVSANGHFVSLFEGPDSGSPGAFMKIYAEAQPPGGVTHIRGIIAGPTGDLMASSLMGTSGVVSYEGLTGDYIGQFGDATDGWTWTMAYGPDDNLYTVNFLSGEVKRYDGATGAFIDSFAQMNGPYATDLLWGATAPDYIVLPEPATMALLACCGLVGLFLRGKR